MKVLIPGIAGLLARKVAQRLLAEGHQVIGIDPLTWMVDPDRWAMTWKVTDLVVPCIMRSPVAVAVTWTPSAGSVLSWIGLVSLNVAVGKVDVSMMRCWNWPSR